MSLNENKDLKFIKKHYGEEFAKCCREWFPTLLEQPGLLSTVISEHIEPTKNLLQDMKEKNSNIDAEEFFKNFVYSFVDVEQEKPQVITNKTVEELFDEAGYVLYPECKTEKDVQKFKKFYAPGEELCTFRGGRLDYCRVWFAVKKNVKNIKREDFSRPQRQDEYGTSVISIQYTKKEPSTLSIKNRYNHTVNNPDATFSNNLNNIVPGLKEAFEQKFFIVSEKGLIMDDIEPYVLVDQKLYRYNFERDNIYYCSNNVIIDNFEVKRFDKARYVVFDKYIIDKKDKTIVCYNNTNKPEASQNGFTQSFGEIKEIIETTTKKGREIVVIPKNGEGIKLVLNDNNLLVEYHNNNLTAVGDKFWDYAPNLTSFSAPNLKAVGQGFLRSAENLTSFSAPSLEQAGNGFLNNAENLTSFSAPNLREVGNHCLSKVYNLTDFYAPKLETVGDDFLCDARNLTNFDAPNLTTVGDAILYDARNLTNFSAPKLETVGDNFGCYASNLMNFSAPNLKTVGDDFLYDAHNLTNFDAPNLTTVGDHFLKEAKNISEFDCPIVPEHLRGRTNK